LCGGVKDFSKNTNSTCSSLKAMLDEKSLHQQVCFTISMLQNRINLSRASYLDTNSQSMQKPIEGAIRIGAFRNQKTATIRALYKGGYSLREH
jgi:hypothetical protein